jgi:serine/threonine protein phosphatase 1
MRWIIGDIHGMVRPLEALVKAVQRQDGEAKFYFVGDYVNRGPESRRVVDFLLTLKNAKFIRGNHDDVFDLILHRKAYDPHPDADSPGSSFKFFLNHGLDTTLISYGIDRRQIQRTAMDPNKQALEDLLAPVPKAHRDFFRNLPVMVDEPDLFIVHAKWDPNEATQQPDLQTRIIMEPRHRHQILWGRFTEEEITSKKAWERTGYFGHTPVSIYSRGTENREHLPAIGHKIVLLDTGAALSSAGRLTGYCAETRKYLQSDRAGTIVQA